MDKGIKKKRVQSGQLTGKPRTRVKANEGVSVKPKLVATIAPTILGQPLTGKQKRHLRALGAVLDPVVQIGKAGVAATVVEGAGDALKARELIKVRVLKNSPEEPRDAIAALAQATDAEVVQVIGRNGLLYKQNPEKTKIELP